MNSFFCDVKQFEYLLKFFSLFFLSPCFFFCRVFLLLPWLCYLLGLIWKSSPVNQVFPIFTTRGTMPGTHQFFIFFRSPDFLIFIFPFSHFSSSFSLDQSLTPGFSFFLSCFCFLFGLTYIYPWTVPVMKCFASSPPGRSVPRAHHLHPGVTLLRLLRQLLHHPHLPALGHLHLLRQVRDAGGHKEA